MKSRMKKFVIAAVLAVAVLGSATAAYAVWTQGTTNTGNTVRTDSIRLLEFGQPTAYFTDSDVLTPDAAISKQITLKTSEATLMKVTLTPTGEWNALTAEYQWSTDNAAWHNFTETATDVYTMTEAKAEETFTLYVRIEPSDEVSDYTALSGYTFTFDLTLEEVEEAAAA